jgi:hypothetical protein
MGAGTTDNGHGFSSCTNLTNSTGTGAGTGNGRGFHSCTNLTNCTGMGAGTTATNGHGLHSCTNLTNCTGTGAGAGYAFYLCKGMLLNKPSSASTGATYYSCYVSISGSGAAPADTAAGGWNKVNV